jgi:polynucleotide 5'-kinase involved in rRNA processing
LYDRYVPLAATKEKLTSTENCKQSYIAFQEQEIHAIFDFKLSTVENPSNHKYIGLQSLLDSKPTKSKREQMKVVLVGEGAVGKTSLIKTMCNRYDFYLY